jgi:hypothetical protein
MKIVKVRRVGNSNVVFQSGQPSPETYHNGICTHWDSLASF